MADTLKVLGQTLPNAATLTDHYNVPAATTATISTMIATNQGASKAKIRVSIAVAGAADALKQYLLYDATLKPYAALPLTIGIALGALDVIRVWSDTGQVSFNTFGAQVT